MALPICFVALLIAIKNATDDDDQTSNLVEADFPKNEDAFKPLSFYDYVTALQADRVCELQDRDFFGLPLPGSVLGVSGMERQSRNWMVPIVKCDHRRCEYESRT